MRRLSQKYLIYGKNGWIGGQLADMLKAQGKTVVLGDARLENRESLFAEIDRVKPTHILDAAGVTGRCVLCCAVGCCLCVIEID